MPQIMTSAGPIWYPTQWASFTRRTNGDVVLPDGSILPYAAACPPDTSPVPPSDPAYGTCVPFPGARNINWECGGLLAPMGSDGCAIPTPPAQHARGDIFDGRVSSPRYDSYCYWPSRCAESCAQDEAPAIGGNGAALQFSDWLCLAAATVGGLVVGHLFKGGRRQ